MILLLKNRNFFGIFLLFFVLYTCKVPNSLAQVVDNAAYIELGETDISIDRPFTISIIIPNSNNRPTITFPDIVGLNKKGITTSTTPTEINEKTVTSQVITQIYRARAPGRYVLPPFSVTIDGEVIRSEGGIVEVRPSSATDTESASQETTIDIVPEGAAFLSLRVSKSSMYVGENVALTLSFFVADNYPYVLNFTALDKQVQAIVKKIRPVNTWEENVAINELKPIPIQIGKKPFREYRIYQSVFFPLSAQPIRIPAVSLQLTRQRPIIGPPTAESDKVTFTSKPVSIAVKPLPNHPLQTKVSVGQFHIEESLDRLRIRIGQSTRYTFTIAGEGNIAALSPPTLMSNATLADVFPPTERHVLSHLGNLITGRKSFTYFIVPHKNGRIDLANFMYWIYFNPKTAQYDTLRPRAHLQVGGVAVSQNVANAVDGVSENELAGVDNVATSQSLYKGLEKIDSTNQSISLPFLIRAIANVLILVMLLGMIFIFFTK